MLTTMSLSFGDLELDLTLFELRRTGIRVPLEPQAFDVLSYLVAHRDRVVSKEELMDQIWGGRFISETAVTSRIKQVRRAVGDHGRAQRVIVTVHGRGYRFAAPVRDGSSRPAPKSAAPDLTRMAQPTSPTRTSVHTVPPTNPAREVMVGRVAERAAIRDLLDRARGGRGHTLLVSGEPGIGKSALLAEAAVGAGDLGALVLRGRAAGMSGPYRVFSEALIPAVRAGRVTDSADLGPFGALMGRVIPGWSTGAVPEIGVDQPLLLAEGLARLLESAAPLCLLVLEDLHEADADSLALLDRLAGIIDQLPVLVLGSHRDWPRTLELDQLASTPYATRRRLGRLPRSEAAELVQTIQPLADGLRDAVVERSEGLPYVLVELAASVAATASGAELGLPAGFAELVEGRMAALTATERRLLTAAATLGLEPDWDLVSQLAELDESTTAAGLQRAVELHLLTWDEVGLRWRHGLVRQSLWTTMLPPERRRLSRAAAQALLAHPVVSQRRAAVDLLVTAGESATAGQLLLGWAREAIHDGAVRTAAELLDRAELVAGESVATTVVRVELLILSGQADGALLAGAHVLDASRGDQHAELCLRLAAAAVAAGRWSVAASYVARAGRPADGRSLVLLAESAHGAAAIGEAARLADQAVARARADGPAETLCAALCVRARVARLDSPTNARIAFGEAAQVSSEHGLKAWRVEALIGLGTLELLADEASPSLLEAGRAAAEAGLIGKAAQVELVLSEHELITRGPTALEPVAQRLIDFGRALRAPVYTFVGGVLLATKHALAGDVRAMDQRLAELGDDSDLGPDTPGPGAGRTGARCPGRQRPGQRGTADDRGDGPTDQPRIERAHRPLRDLGGALGHGART